MEFKKVHNIDKININPKHIVSWYTNIDPTSKKESLSILTTSGVLYTDIKFDKDLLERLEVEAG